MSTATTAKALGLLLIVTLFGCNEGAKTAWTAVAKDCAVSDLNGDKILFFGPSNVIGPGSIWREASPESGGGYRVRWDSDALPKTPKWTQGGGEFACSGSKKIKFAGDAAASFSADLAPLSAEAKADFARAKEVEIKASMMQWDLILEGPFEQVMIGLPANNAVRQDLSKPGRLVLYRALKVRGFEAKMAFDTAAGTALQAKYKNGAIKSLNGDLGVGLNFKWTGVNELVISAPSDFYVAGELVKFDSGAGFAASAKSAFSKPVDVRAGAKIEVEKVQ